MKNAVELEPGRGKPLLMLYSIVDDRSGVSYQEYHEVYGEDVGAALKFLFNAMSPKQQGEFSFQGIPSMIYMDNGPISRSGVFQKVMNYLGVEVRTHVALMKRWSKSDRPSQRKSRTTFPYCQRNARNPLPSS